MTDNIEWSEVEFAWCRLRRHHNCRGWFQDTDHSGLTCICTCHQKEAA